MRREKIFGERIIFSVIVLILASVYLSVDVEAENECKNWDEYCSGFDQFKQPYYLRGNNYCYYKDKVGGDDAKACQARFGKSECWTEKEVKCQNNQECCFNGCVPKGECKPPIVSPPQPPPVQQQPQVATKPIGSRIAEFSGNVKSDLVEEHKEVTVTCSAGSKITELQPYYYCTDEAVDPRSVACPLKRIGDNNGLIAGGVGQISATYRFDNSACGDPCDGVKKKGKLIAKCSPSTTPETVDRKENEIEIKKPSEIKVEKKPITPKEPAAIRAPKIVASAECINDTRFDFNNNTKVDLDDYFLFAENFDKKVNDSYVGRFDLDRDAIVDLDDFFLFSNEFGKEICKEALGDRIKTNLNNCNDKCDDFDGCNCGSNQTSICVYQTIEFGQTCGGKKPEEKTTVEKVVEFVKDIFVEPNHCEDGVQNKDEGYVDCGGKDCKKCLDVRIKSEVCKNLGYGERCDVDFKVKVNAGKGSSVSLPVVFEYKGNKISKNSVLSVAGVKSSKEVPAATGSTVIDVTGNQFFVDNIVAGVGTITQSSRFNCVLVNKPEICCPFGFRVSSQDPQKCVRDEIVVVAEKALPEKNLYDKFLELAQKYLSAKENEKENIKKELKELK